jgi:hypothetical protein
MTMKLEYLAAGSRDCPLVRLSEFDEAEVRSLRILIRSLVTGQCQSVALEGEEWVESVGGCRLTLRQGGRNLGLRELNPLNFECVLESGGWSNVEGLLDVFCGSDSSGFQWLTREGSVGLLISQNGQW